MVGGWTTFSEVLDLAGRSKGATFFCAGDALGKQWLQNQRSRCGFTPGF